jgi:hypothetical protein
MSHFNKQHGIATPNFVFALSLSILFCVCSSQTKPFLPCNLFLSWVLFSWTGKHLTNRSKALTCADTHQFIGRSKFLLKRLVEIFVFLLNRQRQRDKDKDKIAIAITSRRDETTLHYTTLHFSVLDCTRLGYTIQ